MIFWNSEDFIAAAIESVRAQSFTDWELVLVDDGGSDGSTAIALDYARIDPRIRYASHDGRSNRGMSASRNLGARDSGADYLAFIDSDDVWEPEKLEDQVAILDGMPQAVMVLGALNYWSSWDPEAEGTDSIVLTGNISDELMSPPSALLTLYPLGRTPGAGVDLLVRRTVFEAVGGFEPAFKGMYEDQCFLAKIFLEHPVFISSKAWLRYRQHRRQATSTIGFETSSYDRHRRAYLDWLKSYSRSRGSPHPEVERALRKARFWLAVAPLQRTIERPFAPLRRAARKLRRRG